MRRAWRGGLLILIGSALVGVGIGVATRPGCAAPGYVVNSARDMRPSIVPAWTALHTFGAGLTAADPVTLTSLPGAGYLSTNGSGRIVSNAGTPLTTTPTLQSVTTAGASTTVTNGIAVNPASGPGIASTVATNDTVVSATTVNGGQLLNGVQTIGSNGGGTAVTVQRSGSSGTNANPIVRIDDESSAGVGTGFALGIRNNGTDVLWVNRDGSEDIRSDNGLYVRTNALGDVFKADGSGVNAYGSFSTWGSATVRNGLKVGVTGTTVSKFTILSETHTVGTVNAHATNVENWAPTATLSPGDTVVYVGCAGLENGLVVQGMEAVDGSGHLVMDVSNTSAGNITPGSHTFRFLVYD